MVPSLSAKALGLDRGAEECRCGDGCDPPAHWGWSMWRGLCSSPAPEKKDLGSYVQLSLFPDIARINRSYSSRRWSVEVV